MLFFSNLKPYKSSWDKALSPFPHPQSLCGRSHTPGMHALQLVPPPSWLSFLLPSSALWSDSLAPSLHSPLCTLLYYLVIAHRCLEARSSLSLLLPQGQTPGGVPTSLNERPVHSQAGLVSNSTQTWVVSGECTGLGGGMLVETLSSTLERWLPSICPASRGSYFQLLETGSESWPEKTGRTLGTSGAIDECLDGRAQPQTREAGRRPGGRG